MFPVSINDSLGMLSAADQDHIQARSERWGFELGFRR